MNKDALKKICWEDFEYQFLDCFGVLFSIENIATLISDCTVDKGWKKCEDWYDLDDISLMQILKNEKPFAGNLCIVTDVSYYKTESPFLVNSFELTHFINEYFSQYKECIFSGDVLVTNFITKELWLFHHEGVYKYHQGILKN